MIKDLIPIVGYPDIIEVRENKANSEIRISLGFYRV